MQVPLYYYNNYIKNGQPTYELEPKYIGYVDVDIFNADEIWELCNWSCYIDEKPQNLHSEINAVGRGLLLINPTNNDYCLSLSHGWLIGNKNEISKYVSENMNNIFWM